MYFLGDSAGRRSGSGPGNDRAFWRQHTYTCLGPDGKVVDDFECGPARGCYEEL